MTDRTFGCLHIGIIILIITLVPAMVWKVGVYDPQKEKEELKKGIRTTAIVVDKEEQTSTSISSDTSMGFTQSGQMVMMIPSGQSTETETHYILYLSAKGETYKKTVDSKTYNRFNVKDDVNVIVYGDNKIKIEY